MRRRSVDFDWLTMVLYAALVLMGWMAIYAVSSGINGASPFDLSLIHGKQLIWIGISLVLGLVILSLDYQFIETTSYLVYGLSIGVLILTLIIGKEVNGAKSWLMIGSQPFQPSEFAKIATALALSRYMSKLGFTFSNLKDLLGAIGIVLLPAVVVILQNDTGSALVFFSLILVFYRHGLHPLVLIFSLFTALVAIATLWLGEPLWVLGSLVGLAVVSFWLLYNGKRWSRLLTLHLLALGFYAALTFSVDYLFNQLQIHQQYRIQVWFDPMVDPSGAGYNVIQSKIAIGSGGILGKGFLDGNYTKYQFVPKQETDFIFCTIGEEFGWLGSSVVLILFMALITRIFQLSELSKTRYARIYGYSVMSILFFHVLVNVGMTIGLVPVIGIPLPFFSYGGSSLIAFTILISIMLNFYS
ncbi:MAG: rod shape-determining protein RodA, partial [Bacteroidota bacterium]